MDSSGFMSSYPDSLMNTPTSAPRSNMLSSFAPQNIRSTPTTNSSHFSDALGLDALQGSHMQQATVPGAMSVYGPIESLQKDVQRLSQENLFLHGQVEGMKSIMDRLTEKWPAAPNISESGFSSMSIFTGELIPVVGHVTYSSDDQIKFLAIKFWVRSRWFKYLKTLGDTIDVDNAADEGDDEALPGVAMDPPNRHHAFLEDIDGNTISGREVKEARQYMRKIFNELLR
ncbi:hypothetical protein PM082_006280 [Marasmius tenuissimus]|nr:hypothetical protein PM082_006280 [Marasmius tenuissimus]